MYFVRKYKSGAGDHDPRQLRWAVFHCSLCGEESDINITSNFHTFDFARERKCSHCGQINAEDKAINLNAQLEKLTSDKNRIQVEIDKVERELNEIDKPKKA